MHCKFCNPAKKHCCPPASLLNNTKEASRCRNDSGMIGNIHIRFSFLFPEAYLFATNNVNKLSFMKYIFFINLVFILFVSGSCTKKNTVQVLNPGPIISNNASGVAFDTIHVVLTAWYQLPDNKYRSVLSLPTQPDYDASAENIRLFINYFGRYQAITDDPVNYLGGKLWFENYPGENALFFQYKGGILPFDSLAVSAIITLQQH